MIRQTIRRILSLRFTATKLQFNDFINLKNLCILTLMHKRTQWVHRYWVNVHIAERWVAIYFHQIISLNSTKPSEPHRFLWKIFEWWNYGYYYFFFFWIFCFQIMGSQISFNYSIHNRIHGAISLFSKSEQIIGWLEKLVFILEIL